jgi:hypothetical protein
MGWLNAVATFVIGLVAGVSPFLFLTLLPSLLNPSQNLVEPNYIAIVLTGTLVGTIITILFAKGFEERQPTDVFFYALGIPAILIATVSNLSTKSQAAMAVSAAQVAASNAVLNPSPPPIQAVPIQTLPQPAVPPASYLRPGSAWAQERRPPETSRFVQAGGEYFVAIGRYPSAGQAWKAVEDFGRRPFKTEVYVPRSLQVVQVGPGLYYVTYTYALPRENALKLYNLLRINDPQTAPEILRKSG